MNSLRKPRRYSLILPIRGCAAGQGMVFYLSVLKQCVYIIWRESVLNRVYDFVRVGPNKNGMNFVCALSI